MLTVGWKRLRIILYTYIHERSLLCHQWYSCETDQQFLVIMASTISSQNQMWRFYNCQMSNSLFCRLFYPKTNGNHNISEMEHNWYRLLLVFTLITSNKVNFFPSKITKLLSLCSQSYSMPRHFTVEIILVLRQTYLRWVYLSDVKEKRKTNQQCNTKIAKCKLSRKSKAAVIKYRPTSYVKYPCSEICIYLSLSNIQFCCTLIQRRRQLLCFSLKLSGCLTIFWNAWSSSISYAPDNPCYLYNNHILT